MEEILHFWFSEEQNSKNFDGELNPLALLDSGKIVEYTECSENDKPFGNWHDYVYLGRGKIYTTLAPIPGTEAQYFDNFLDDYYSED